MHGNAKGRSGEGREIAGDGGDAGNLIEHVVIYVQEIRTP